MVTPGLIALDPKHDSLYVGRSMTAPNPPKSLAAISRKNFKLVDEQEILIPRPHALAVTKDGKYVYIGSLGENRFASVETATGHVAFSPFPDDGVSLAGAVHRLARRQDDDHRWRGLQHGPRL